MILRLYGFNKKMNSATYNLRRWEPMRRCFFFFWEKCMRIAEDARDGCGQSLLKKSI